MATIIVDSRQKGFNAEVDTYKAEVDKLLHPVEVVKPQAKLEPPKPRKPLEIICDLEAYVRDVFGSHPRFEELINEFWRVVKE
jgi:hypothetical protein